MMAAILNSAMLDSDTTILDSDTLLSSLRFTQKHSHSILTLTQTNSIWLKLIHSHSTWWWQPSWILPCWIQTPCFLLWNTPKNTLSPLWLWFKLIISDKLDDGKTFTHSFSLNLTWWWQPLARFSSHHFAQNKTFTHSCWLNMMMAAILNSAFMLDSDTTILDSDTLLSSLRFTQKHSHPKTLSLHSDSDSN